MKINFSRIHFHFYILPFIFLMITLYFTYHLIQGERGIFRLFEVNEELRQAQTLLDQTTKEKKYMETKVKSLSSSSLNPDTLDEAGRRELDVINPNEFVIFE